MSTRIDLNRLQASDQMLMHYGGTGSTTRLWFFPKS